MSNGFDPLLVFFNFLPKVIQSLFFSVDSGWGTIRTLILFSTILSVLGLVTAFTLQLSNISILLAAVLFLAHLPVLWISRREAGAGQG